MAKLTIIVGIGGSGKTHLCADLAKGGNARPFYDATLAGDDNKRAGFNCLGEMVARLLGTREDCVMDESHLTVPSFREKFKRFCDQFLIGVEQEWIFFERDVVSCINNVHHDYQIKGRQELSRLKAVRGQSRDYEVPPPGAYPGHQLPRPVYRRPSPIFDDHQEAEAFAWLESEIARLEK